MEHFKGHFIGTPDEPWCALPPRKHQISCLDSVDCRLIPACNSLLTPPLKRSVIHSLIPPDSQGGSQIDPPSRKTSCAAIRSIVCKWSPAVIFCRFCFSCRESPPLCTPWDSPHLVTECDKCYRVSNISIQIRQLLWVIFMTKIPTGF